MKGLDEIGLKHNVPQGTYFVMIDIQEFLDLPQFQGWTDLEFCEWMIKKTSEWQPYRDPVSSVRK